MKYIVRSLACTLCCILTSTVIYAQSMNIASYNIRNNNQGDVKNWNGWPQRLPAVAALINYHEFDIFGAQEVLHNQVTDLLTQLPAFEYTGVARDDGQTKGEYSPIFYRKDRFKILKSGTFWLAEKTDKPVKGWDAALPRICSYAQFKDLKSKKSFWVFNLHMDHIGVVAREKSAELVLQKVQEIAKGQHVLLMGDFNVDQKNNSYAILNNSKLLKDSYELSPLRYALNGTFNAFDANLFTESRIDHIFVTPDIDVQKYGILTDTYRMSSADAKELKKGDFPAELSFKDYIARMPSDHFPVAIRVEIK